MNNDQKEAFLAASKDERNSRVDQCDRQRRDFDAGGGKLTRQRKRSRWSRNQQRLAGTTQMWQVLRFQGRFDRPSSRVLNRLRPRRASSRRPSAGTTSSQWRLAPSIGWHSNTHACATKSARAHALRRRLCRESKQSSWSFSTMDSCVERRTASHSNQAMAACDVRTAASSTLVAQQEATQGLCCTINNRQT